MSIASPCSGDSINLLIRRLNARATLSPAEREFLATQHYYTRSYAAGAAVRVEDECPNRPTLIVSGWACREQISPNGRRQLVSLLMPGDVIWAAGERRPIDLLEVVALSNLKVVDIADVTRAITKDPARFPSIVFGLGQLQFAEELNLLEHVVRLGSQPAHQRVAGLFIELYERARSIGFVTGRSFVVPLTQEHFGNLVGLSIVHIHRVLRRFKAEGVLQIRSGLVEILDEAGLARIAESSMTDYPCLPAITRQRVDRPALEMSAG